MNAPICASSSSVYGRNGLQTRDFPFVADAVTATATAAVRGVPGRVYNIGGGARVSLREVFDLIARVSGEGLRAMWRWMEATK